MSNGATSAEDKATMMSLQNSTPHQDTSSAPPHRHPQLHINVVIQSPLQLTVAHRVHLAGEYSTGAGRWYYFIILGKYNNLLVINFCGVCPRPPPSNIGSSYYQQSRIMESEDEAMGIPIDPHRRTIHHLQIFIQSYQQQGFLMFLLIYGNQDNLHVFQQQDIPTKACTPIGFNYDINIDGSIATLIEACNLVNIHKLKHGDAPATHNTGSLQIYFDFLSYAATESIYKCGIVDFNALFSSDHRALFIEIDILRLLGFPVQGTQKALKREL
jgi:hypothetical protein